MKDDESNSELSVKLQPTYLFWQSKFMNGHLQFQDMNLDEYYPSPRLASTLTKQTFHLLQKNKIVLKTFEIIGT
jgi:hypothetical protein